MPVRVHFAGTQSNILSHFAIKGFILRRIIWENRFFDQIRMKKVLQIGKNVTCQSKFRL